MAGRASRLKRFNFLKKIAISRPTGGPSYLSIDNFVESVLSDDGSNSSGVMGTDVCAVPWAGSFSNLENARPKKPLCILHVVRRARGARASYP